MLSAVAARKAAAAQKTLLTSDEQQSIKRKLSEVERQDAPPRRPPPPKRTWSPSTPLPLSDEEEDIEHEELDVGHSQSPIVTSTTLPVVEQALLSTWRPVKDGNFFVLDASDLAECNISELSCARLLLLRAQDRLALLGVYALTVLQGAVSVAGTALLPGISHRVFAPRSSPIPVIECRGPNGGTQPFQLPPSRLRSDCVGFDAVVLLQQQNTGIEGLGRIYRIFEDVFVPPHVERTAGTAETGLNGVYYVRSIYCPYTCLTSIQVETQISGLSPVVIEPSWRSAIENVMRRDPQENTRCVYMVRGTRKSGKSTFARTLLNTLVTRSVMLVLSVNDMTYAL